MVVLDKIGFDRTTRKKLFYCSLEIRWRNCICYISEERTDSTLQYATQNTFTFCHKNLSLKCAIRQHYLQFLSFPTYLNVFQSVLRKVRHEDALKISDAVMGALLQMLTAQTGQAGGVQEDALLAVGTLVEGILRLLIRRFEF